MAKAKSPNLTDFQSFPETAKVRVHTVAGLFAVSEPTVWRRVRQGLIPAPHKIGGTTVWNAGDIRKALSSTGGR